MDRSLGRMRDHAVSKIKRENIIDALRDDMT